MRWIVICGLLLVCLLPIPLKAQEELPPPAAIEDEPVLKVPDVIADPAKVEPLPPPKWDGSLEFGINGTEGNSKLFKIRTAGSGKRETKGTVLKIDGFYSFARANDEPTENRALLEGRHEWALKKAKWSLFVSTSAYYDQFKDYDVRWAAHAGPSYQWVKNETIDFKTRGGFGGSKEFGGTNTEFKPEINGGFDLVYKLSERQKITSTFDFYPNLTDFQDYWFQARINYEVLVDPTWNLTLKIGVFDRFNSVVVDNKRRNDIEYFAVLMWSF